MPVRQPWHEWYEQFAPESDEVAALRRFEPQELPDWAVRLRQEMPTLPPAGVEMCHARWLETLQRLVEDIGDGASRRRSHWCGDIPLETVAGLGLRRRVLLAWLENREIGDLQQELIQSYGVPPGIAEYYYEVLGPTSMAAPEVKQDVEVLADMWSGPYESGNPPLVAKWGVRHPVLEQRGSILALLKDRMAPVVTHLCNWRTLEDMDRLVGMVASQQMEPEKLGPCNWSLKFILEDRPETVSATIAVVWACHQFSSVQFASSVVKVPLGSRDQAHAISSRLGSPNPVKAWLAGTLGFLTKKWVRRMWHIVGIPVPNTALPDFTFGFSATTSGRWIPPAPARQAPGAMTGRAPKLPGNADTPQAPTDAALGISQKMPDAADMQPPPPPPNTGDDRPGHLSDSSLPASGFTTPSPGPAAFPQMRDVEEDIEPSTETLNFPVDHQQALDEALRDAQGDAATPDADGPSDAKPAGGDPSPASSDNTSITAQVDFRPAGESADPFSGIATDSDPALDVPDAEPEVPPPASPDASPGASDAPDDDASG